VLEPDGAVPDDDVDGQQDTGEDDGDKLRRSTFKDSAEVNFSGDRAVEFFGDVARRHGSVLQIIKLQTEVQIFAKILSFLLILFFSFNIQPNCYTIAHC